LQLLISARGQVALVALIAAVVGVSCSQDFPAKTMPTSFDYFRFQNGRIMEKTVVHQGDRAYDVLMELLKTHGAGWNPDINTYAPALEFKSKDMDINCRDDLVVVNIGETGSDRWKQLVSHFSGCRTKVLEAISRGKQEHDQ
jgi:hypothetical protein